MTYKEAAHKIDDLQFKSWVLLSQLNALNDALFNGLWEAKTYEGAMYAAVMAAQELSSDAVAVTELMFATLRSEKDLSAGGVA